MRRLTTGLVAVSLVLVAAGCADKSGGVTATSGSNDAASGSDVASWTDQVCSSIKDDVAALKTEPELDLSNAQTAKDGVTAYLGNLVTSLDKIAGVVKDAGTPPVEGGDAAVKRFDDQISAAKDAVNAAKDTVNAAPVTDPAGFQAAFDAAEQHLAKLDTIDPTNAFAANKALNDAYNKTASCQELESSQSSTPTS